MDSLFREKESISVSWDRRVGGSVLVYPLNVIITKVSLCLYITDKFYTKHSISSLPPQTFPPDTFMKSSFINTSFFLQRD